MPTTISLASAPNDLCEWKVREIPVTITSSGTPGWSTGELRVSIIYHQGTASELVIGPSIGTEIDYESGTRIVNVTIQPFFSCNDNVALSVILDADTGAHPAVSKTLNGIYSATRVYTGGPWGPFGGSGRAGCRWTTETVRIRMCDGIPVSEADIGSRIISTWGNEVDPDTLAVTTTHPYHLAASGGISFRNLAGSAITSTTFSAGSTEFRLRMNQIDPDVNLTLTNEAFPEESFAGQELSVINPYFSWNGLTGISAYEIRTGITIEAENTLSGPEGVGFSHFPTADFTVSADPVSAAIITKGNFTGNDTLVTAPLTLAAEGVRTGGTTLTLTFGSDTEPAAVSPPFTIGPPDFEWSGGPFSRFPLRFYSGESAGFTVTARSGSGAVLNRITAQNDWSVSGLSSAVTDLAAVNGAVTLTAAQGTFPAPSVVQDYTFGIQRASEPTLAGTQKLRLAGKASLNPSYEYTGTTLTVSGQLATHSEGISVRLTLTGDALQIMETTTDAPDGHFSASFAGIAPGGSYVIRAREEEDPGTSTESNPLTLTLPAAALPVWNIKLEDGAGPELDLIPGDGVSEPPLLVQSERTLTISLESGYPQGSPLVTLTVPGGAAVTGSLIWNAAAGSYDPVTFTETEISADGIYRIEVPEYTDALGAKAGPLSRRFHLMTNPGTRSVTGALHGWGYYPREEGSFSSCPEQLPPLSVPVWTPDGGTATITPVLGQPLRISSTAGSTRMIRRTWPDTVWNSLSGDLAGSADAVLEAMISVTVSTAGSPLTGTDSTGAEIRYRLPGPGMELRNGMRQLNLYLADLEPGTPWAGRRLAVTLFDGRVMLSGTVVGSPLVIRAETDNTGADPFWQVLWKDPSEESWHDTGLRVPFRLLPGGADGTPWTASVAFGHPSGSGQSSQSEWEFVRYSLYDTRYRLVPGDTFRIGTSHGQRAADNGEFYRSADIVLNGNPAADQPGVGINSVAVNLTREISPVPFTGVPVPVKIRYLLLDWDDSAETSTDGFQKENFPALWAGSGTTLPLPGAAPATAALLLDANGTVNGAGPATWNFQFTAADQARRSRRLVLLAVADAPLLPSPEGIKGHCPGTILKPDPLRTDFRVAAFQFLPDYYIRERESDQGTDMNSSWNSPDIRAAVFSGDPDSCNPHDLDPAFRYPAGFARGEAAVTTTPLETFADTKGGAGIMMSDAQIDGSTTPHRYNRIWARISNRGVVPGPANVQIYSCDSQIRTDFVPAMARDQAWEQIYGDTSAAGDARYLQNRFLVVRPKTGTTYPVEAVGAIPALCGNSTPTGMDRFFPLAEFRWYIPLAANVPDTGSVRHSCLACFINQQGWSTGVDTARRIDGGPMAGTPDLSDAGISIGPISAGSNNVTIRNQNIVDATPSDSPVNMLFRPDRFILSPVNYRLTFNKRPENWSFRLTAPGFNGRLIICLPPELVRKANLSGFKRLGAKDFDPAVKPIKALTRKLPMIEGGLVKPVKPKPGFTEWSVINNLAWFELNGKGGTLTGLTPDFRLTGKKAPRIRTDAVNLFFIAAPNSAPGLYPVLVEQLAGRNVIGAYTSVIRIRKRLIPPIKEPVNAP